MASQHLEARFILQKCQAGQFHDYGYLFHITYLPNYIFQNSFSKLYFPGHIPTDDNSQPLHLALQQQEDHVHGQVSGF